MKECIVFLEPKGTILEVIREASRRGYFVVAVVSDLSLLQSASEPYSSAVPLIGSTIQIDSWEMSSVCENIIQQINELGVVKGIYSGVDPCAAVGAKLRTHYHLPTPSLEAMTLILDKYRLRTRLRELGLSKLECYSGSEIEKWTSWELKKSGYFKPVHGFFSAYVQKCNSLENVIRAKTKWVDGDKTDSKFIRNYTQSKKEYLVEEAIEGELLSVEGFSSQGVFHCVGLLSRILYSKDTTVEMGSCFPYLHPLTEKIVSLVEKVHKAVGFTDGPSHTEVIVNTAGHVEVIDFNPRFVGADVLQSINFAYGIKIEETLLDWAIGNPIKIQPTQSQFACLQYILPPEPIKFEKIDYPKSKEVPFHTTFLKPGTNAQSVERQLDYLGCYLTLMPSFMKALAKSRELRDAVTINSNLKGAY